MPGVVYVHRVVFFANNKGPYKCSFCHKQVLKAKLIVHHLDEDRTNNDPSNLAAAHNACHTRFHRLGSSLVHCQRGHPFTEDNTYAYNKTNTKHRRCKECQKASNRRAKARRLNAT